MNNININENFINCAKEKRIPLSCTLELTRICNFNCPHCYLKGSNLAMIPLDFTKKLLYDLRKKGTYFLTLTGGEVLLYSDFADLYSYAYDIGFSITLFTNGYLIDDKIKKLLIKKPPQKIEISVYGISNDEYYGASNVIDPFDKVISNIKFLKENNIKVVIKYVITNYNIHIFSKIKQLATDMDLEFRYDYYVWPTLTGDLSITKFQCSTKRVINLLLEEKPTLLNEWKERYKEKITPKCFNCGGGRYSLYITSELLMKPCLYADYCVYDLKAESFDECWNKMGIKLDNYNKSIKSKCFSCKYSNICDACPAYIYSITKKTYLEDNDVIPSCEIAKEKAISVFNNINVLPYLSVDIVKKIFKKNRFFSY